MSETRKIKVLVIRFSSIGDIVLCSPVFRCLKKITGVSVETHLLTKKSFHSFTSNYSYIDKLHSFEKDLKGLIKELKKENFDFVLDLHNNLRSLRVKVALGKPSRAFEKLNIEKWLLTTFKINRMPKVHIVDRLMEAAKPLGIVNDGEGLDFFIPEAEEVDLKLLPDVFLDGFIGFVIGGTYATKRLPAEQIAAICHKVHRPVVLLGGPEDRDTGDAIVEMAGKRVYNACGRFSLNGSASLVKQACAVISHDTGLMHIAAAFSKPIASVWGNTVPEFGMYPYFARGYNHEQSEIFQVSDLKCRPCSKIGYDKCPRKHFRCMLDIPVQDLIEWANRF